MKAYWFSNDNNLPLPYCPLQTVDGKKQPPASVGGSHVYVGDLKVGGAGLHWAENLIAAIRFGVGGPICWEVELDDEHIIKVGPNQMDMTDLDPKSMYTTWGCSNRRTYLSRTDFMPILCDVMADVLHDIPTPDHLVRTLRGMTHAQVYLAKGDRNLAWGYARVALFDWKADGNVPWKDIEGRLRDAFKVR